MSVVLFIVSHGIQAGLGFTLPSFKLDNEVSVDVDQSDKSVENSLINSSIQTLELNLNLASVSFLFTILCTLLTLFLYRNLKQGLFLLSHRVNGLVNNVNALATPSSNC